MRHLTRRRRSATVAALCVFILAFFALGAIGCGTEEDSASSDPGDATPTQERDTGPEEAPEENCHPSYDPCLDPNASDYDCDGGSGDGPSYTGPVTVKGDDPYDLDRDGDGYACES